MRLLRIVALSFGLMSALVGSQLPEFMQQYRQRLGGAIDELARIVARFDMDAALNNLTRDKALARLAQSSDDIVRRRGFDMTENIRQLAALENQRRAMNEAGLVARVGYFFGYADEDLIRATMRDFEPAVPTTGEGLMTAALSFVCGWGIIRFIGWPLRRWHERRLGRRMP